MLNSFSQSVQCK